MSAKNLIIFFFCLCISGSIWGQKAVEKADKAFDLSQYSYAITLYQKAFTKVKKSDATGKNRIIYRIGECYRLSGQFKKAATQYRKAIRARYYDIEPKVYFYLGEIHRFNGEYAEAAEQYRLYLELTEDPTAEMALQSCELSEKWLKEPSRYEVENIRKINARENDWAPRFLDQQCSDVIFTSSREGATGKKLDDWTGQRFTDLFISSQDKKGDWGTPVLLDKDKILNTIANEADAFFVNNGMTVYFTLCANEKKKQSGCLIYTSNYNGESWSEPVYVPLFPDSLADCIHPWVSSDQKTLYFSSNMSGGFGDLDIWYATRNSPSEEFSTPINAGEKINTIGKEGWPFLRDTLLYFASTGHPGMGGFDLFFSTASEGIWGEAENMKPPINSSADDFGIVFADQRESGFFTSNRNEGRGGDDIWSFVLPTINFTISGVVRNDENLQLVSQALVQIVGSDGLSLQAFTNNKGFYRFDESQIKQDVTYELHVSKSGFNEEEAKETTVGLSNGVDLVRDFRLVPLPKGAVMLPDILYDVAKWDLKEQYQDSLIGLIELLERNPRLIVELASHTDARPIAMTNDSLSQYRAQEVVNYLVLRGIHPLRLIAKGYGSRVPRILDKETPYRTSSGTQGTFPAGTILSAEYILSLPKEVQDIAHQMNRRTEFSILRDDFIPPAEGGTTPTTLESFVQLGDENDDLKIRFRIHPSGLPEVPVVVNGTGFTFMYDEKSKNNHIGIEEATRLLRTGKINKNDFLNREKAIDEDGEIIAHSVLRLKELKIGKATLHQIEVIVTPELQAPIILNAKSLEGLGDFSIHLEDRYFLLKK